MYNKKSNNQNIGTLHSLGLSKLVLSLYETKSNKLNLVFNFVPCVGQDDMGFDKYHETIHESTSIDYTGAVDFYPTVASILKDETSGEQIIVSLPCGRDATLTFEYKPEQDGHRGAYLIINKSNQTIPFRFETYQHQMYNVNGQTVAKVIQVGLIEFARILDGYIRYIRTNGLANKLPEGSSTQAPPNNWNNINH